jgi:hypothetical protein
VPFPGSDPTLLVESEVKGIVVQQLVYGVGDGLRGEIG